MCCLAAAVEYTVLQILSCTACKLIWLYCCGWLVCRQVLRAHKSALYAQRSFWKVLLHSNVTFTAVVKAFRHIESTRTRADKTYQTVLERYPSNVKVSW
jgi:hypothetical protein